MDTKAIKPGRMLYLLSGLVLVSGIILFAVILVSGLFSSIKRINKQVVVPGSEIIEFTETGKYSVYFEYRSVIDGKVFATNSVRGLLCTLRDTETGEYIKLDNSVINSHYSISGREGRSIFDFVINKTGKYELRAWYEDGEGKEAVLAIGKGFGAALVQTILLSIGTLFLSFGAALGIFLYTLLKRKKAKSKVLAQPEA